MLKEIIIETVILAVMAVIAHFIGQHSVILIDRPRGTRGNSSRKAARTKHATALGKQFRRRNRWSEIETESLISLPSVSFNWAIGTIVGTVMAVLLTVNQYQLLLRHMDIIHIVQVHNQTLTNPHKMLTQFWQLFRNHALNLP